MAEEPFVMLSLKDDKAKKLANALTNKSADKILAYLASHDNATESEIAKAIKVPLSTINYTMRVLIEAKLVLANEYSYSEKGREVNHYKLAKKYIIIAPDDADEGFLSRLKNFLPAATLAVALAGIVRLYQMFFSSMNEAANTLLFAQAPVAKMTQDIASDMAVEAAQEMGSDVAANSAMALSARSADVMVAAAPAPFEWFGPFVMGVFLVLLLALIIDYVFRKR